MKHMKISASLDKGTPNMASDPGGTHRHPRWQRNRQTVATVAYMINTWYVTHDIYILYNTHSPVCPHTWYNTIYIEAWRDIDRHGIPLVTLWNLATKILRTDSSKSKSSWMNWGLLDRWTVTCSYHVLFLALLLIVFFVIVGNKVRLPSLLQLQRTQE